jgi:hypothetical protein
MFWVMFVVSMGMLIVAVQTAAAGDLPEAFGALACGLVCAAGAWCASRGRAS